MTVHTYLPESGDNVCGHKVEFVSVYLKFIYLNDGALVSPLIKQNKRR